jgi:hypothetical protein
LLFGRLPLVSLCRIFLSEEVWESSRVRVSSNPKFRVLLRKVSASFHYFGVWILTLRSSSCPVSNILSEEVLGRESSRVRFSSNPKFRFCLERYELSFWGLILICTLRSSPLGVLVSNIFV